MIPGDLLSAFPHRHFHTLPGLLDSQAALSNSYHNTLHAMQGGSLHHFNGSFWYDPARRRTHNLQCERRTRYRLSQPDTILFTIPYYIIYNLNKQITASSHPLLIIRMRRVFCVGALRFSA